MRSMQISRSFHKRTYGVFCYFFKEQSIGVDIWYLRIIDAVRGLEVIHMARYSDTVS